MSDDARYTCECGCAAFTIPTREMVGSDEPYIASIVCVTCGREHTTAPRPTQVHPDDGGEA